RVRDVVDGEDDDVVAGAGPPVFAAIAEEGIFHGVRLPAFRLQVVDVDMLAPFDGRHDLPDVHAVLYDRVAGFEGPERYLVAEGDLAKGPEPQRGPPVQGPALHHPAFADVHNGDADVVLTLVHEE